MKLVAKENITKSHVKLTVAVMPKEFEKACDDAFEIVVKDVKADGFRPGKMPKNMFISRYGYEALYEEAVNIAMNETYPKALEKAEVRPVSDPMITDCSKPEFGKKLTYTVEFDVWPEVELGEYKGLKVKELSRVVTEELINERVQATLRQKADNEIKDGAVENGDTVIIDFEGSVDGVKFPGGKAENYELEIGSHSFIAGFEEALVGMVTGEERDINVTFPENYQPDLAGKDAVFHIVLHEVKQKVYPELNDEFVEDLEIENVKTKDEYLAFVKNQLQDQLNQAADENLSRELIKLVIENATTDAPEALVNSEVEAGVKNLEAQAKQFNLPAEQLLKYQGIESLDAYKEMLKKYITDDVLKEICFSAIAKAEEIKVEPDEVEAEYKLIAGVTAEDDEKAVKEKMAAAQKQYSVAQVASHLMDQKVYNFIKDNAIIEK